MLQIALAFLLGDCVVQLAPDLTSIWIGVAAAATLPLLGTSLRRSAILAFLCGIVWVILNAAWRLAQDLPPELEGRDLSLDGYIASLPEVEPYGTRFEFDVSRAPASFPARHLQLTWYSRNAPIQSGELWRLTVKLKRRHGFANPGGYDYEAQLFRQGINATGYVREGARNHRLAAPSIRYFVLRLRANLVARISAALPSNSMQGVVRGLVVGDQQAVNSAQWDVFARTGTSHLVAISGVHIGMIAVLAAWLGGCGVYLPRAQSWRLTRSDLRASCGLLIAWIYSLLAGMSVPTERTLIMLSVYFGAILLRRHADVWHSFGLALLLVLLLDPFAPLAIGLWLSFGAVAVILLNISGRLGAERMLPQYLRLQWIVTLGLAPPLLCVFGRLSLIAPLVNLAAIPAFTWVAVPTALIGTLLSLVYAPWGAWMLALSAQTLSWIYAALSGSAQLPWVVWYFAQPPWWSALLLTAGVLLSIAPIVWPLRFAGWLLCLPALCGQPSRLASGSVSLTMLDVGQGLSIVVRTREHVLVYDTGPAFRNGRDVGELVVLPYLHAMGIRSLDLLVLSHGDEDHVGGAKSILNGFAVKQVLIGPSVPSPRADAELCRRGAVWSWDAVEFRVLNPGRDETPQSDNDSSCVLAIRAGNGSALLLGDIEKPVEQQLVAEDLIGPTELVVAAHHGSRSSSTLELVQAAQAHYVFFSAGYRNRWGFPKTEVVERWRRQGAEGYSTVDSGAVEWTVERDALAALRRYRKQHRHYWNDSSSAD